MCRRSASPQTTRTPVAEAPARRRVLLLEDEPLLRRALTRRLRRAGADVLAVGTVAAARAALRSGRGFDAVLFDVHLPDGHGHALLREAPEPLRRGARWVATSGHATPREVATIRALGADAFVPKPADPAALLDALDIEVPAA